MNISLSGTWRGTPDPKQIGVKSNWYCNTFDSSSWEEIQIPSCWNTIPRYERYEGIFWFATDFDIPELDNSPDTEYLLRFNAVNYLCRIWVNECELSSHEGGYLPFEVPIPAKALIKNGNHLVVMVENFRSKQRIPGELFDWFNYGGIVRDVWLVARTKRHFKSVRVNTEINADQSATITVDYKCKEPFHFIWTVSFNEEPILSGIEESEINNGRLSFNLKNAHLWSPDDPALYKLALIPSPDETAEPYSVKFGVRDINISGTRIVLNGKPIKLKGVSLHEELVPYGRTIPRELRFKDVADIKSLGFNSLRTAHYSHDEALIEAADEIGLLVLEEIPVYWYIDYKDESVYEKAEEMIRTLIERDFNHPSVIMWSVGNEVPVEDEDCDLFIRRLMAEARSIDPTRLVSYVSSRFIIDKTREASDVCCLNCYIGWYFGDEKDLFGLLSASRETAPGKPWMITEFGACAKHGFKSSKLRSKYSEDRQAEFLEHYIRTINSMDWISGWFIWIYRDFRSPIRTNKYQSGFNRKGIVDESLNKKLICDKLPEILDGRKRLDYSLAINLLKPGLKNLEEFAWKHVQPMVNKKAKSDYDSYFSGIRDKKDGQ